MPEPIVGREFRFVTPTPLRWVDVDHEGIVNHAVYLSLVEQARFAYFTALGLLPGGMLPFVLADTRVSFLAPGRLGMQVETAMAVTRLGRSSFDMAAEVRGDGAPLARCVAALVYVDAAMRPRPIDDAARRAIAAFEGLGMSG